jgi:hypothetical protein
VPNTALFGANKIMEYLTSARINDGSWHGSVENFIINWQNQFRLYERLVPTTSHYKEKQKLAMLQLLYTRYANFAKLRKPHFC